MLPLIEPSAEVTVAGTAATVAVGGAGAAVSVAGGGAAVSVGGGGAVAVAGGGAAVFVAGAAAGVLVAAGGGLLVAGGGAAVGAPASPPQATSSSSSKVPIPLNSARFIGTSRTWSLTAAAWIGLLSAALRDPLADCRVVEIVRLPHHAGHRLRQCFNRNW